MKVKFDKDEFCRKKLFHFSKLTSFLFKMANQVVLVFEYFRFNKKNFFEIKKLTSIVPALRIVH